MIIDFVHLMLEQRRLSDRLDATEALYQEAKRRAEHDPLYAAYELWAALDRVHAEITAVYTEADAILVNLNETFREHSYGNQ